MKDIIESVLLDTSSGIPEEVRSELLRITRGNEELVVLTRYLAEHPEGALTFRKACREHALRFVEQEIARLKAAKASGTLTEQDIAFAKGQLQSLLDSIERLCIQGIRRATGDNSR